MAPILPRAFVIPKLCTLMFLVQWARIWDVYVYVYVFSQAGKSCTNVVLILRMPITLEDSICVANSKSQIRMVFREARTRQIE